MVIQGGNDHPRHRALSIPVGLEVAVDREPAATRAEREQQRAPAPIRPRLFGDKLEYGLKEAVETAAFIATAEAGAAPAKTLRFWQLYWGVTGLVENQQVTDAMIAFGGKFTAKASSSSPQG